MYVLVYVFLYVYIVIIVDICFKEFGSFGLNVFEILIV